MESTCVKDVNIARVYPIYLAILLVFVIWERSKTPLSDVIK